MPLLRILDAAADEAAEAAAWYERRQAGLGSDFSRALEAALDLLEADVLPLTPVPGEPGRRGARRLRLRRFPYYVVVRKSGEEIIVVAIAHEARRPGYWRNR
jgi:plasmid stabilization system protein ParE